MFDNIVYAASAGAGQQGGNIWFTVGYIAVIFLLMYFLFIRPQKKKQKQADEMRNNLVVGDRVITIGGIVGKITKLDDDEITIETSDDKTKMVFIKSAIYEKKAKPE